MGTWTPVPPVSGCWWYATPGRCRQFFGVRWSPWRTECEVCKRPLATHSAALAELASSGETVFGGCSGCGLLPESFHTSTALVRARETVERFAERLTRERNFSTSSFRMFVQELRAAWH